MIKYLSVFLIFVFSLNNIVHFFYPEFGIDLKLSKNAWILSKEQIKKYTYHTSLFSGLIIGLFEFPCTGGIYLSIVNIMSNTDSYLKGYFLLLLYNVVFITPLIVLFIIILKTGIKNFSTNKWNAQYRSKMKLLTSLIALLLGFALLMYT